MRCLSPQESSLSIKGEIAARQGIFLPPWMAILRQNTEETTIFASCRPRNPPCSYRVTARSLQSSRCGNPPRVYDAHGSAAVNRGEGVVGRVGRWVASLRLDAKLLDDRPPFLGVGFHQGSKGLWCLSLTGENLHSKVG
jgi:hypothetical protein